MSDRSQSPTTATTCQEVKALKAVVVLQTHAIRNKEGQLL